MTRLHLLHTCTATLPSFPGTVTSPEEEEEEEEEEEDATVGAALPGANGGVPSMENRAFHRARSTVVRMDETFSRKTARGCKSSTQFRFVRIRFSGTAHYYLSV